MEQQLANMVNSTHQNTQMLEQMTALASTISTLQAQVNYNQSRGRSSGGGGGGGGGRWQILLEMRRKARKKARYHVLFQRAQKTRDTPS
jgi:hypothetical protein